MEKNISLAEEVERITAGFARLKMDLCRVAGIGIVVVLSDTVKGEVVSMLNLDLNGEQFAWRNVSTAIMATQ